MKILRWLDDNFELLIMGFALTILTAVVLIDVIGRTVLGTGVAWAQEMSRNCEILIAAMGISYGVQAGKHIKVDILPTFFPKFKIPLDVFGDIVTFIFCCFVAWFGVTKLNATLKSGATTAVMEIPMFYIYLTMEIGLCMGAFRVAEKYVKKILLRKINGGGRAL